MAASSSVAHGTKTRSTGARVRDVAKYRSCWDVPRGTATPGAVLLPLEVVLGLAMGPGLVVLGPGPASAPVADAARRWPLSPRGGELPSDSVFVRAMEGGLESEDSLE